MVLIITEEMHKQVTFLSINSAILQGRMEMRADRSGYMPDEQDIISRFWTAFNGLSRLVQDAKTASKLEAKDQEIARLRALVESKGQDAGDPDMPF